MSTKVFVRLRPLIHVPELQDGQLCISEDTEFSSSIRITSPEDPENVREFTCDGIFGSETSQAELFELTAKRLVRGVLEGDDGTIVAYGVIGSGKTHTIQGPEEDPGLIPRCARHIFEHAKRESPQRKFLVCCSMLVIFQGDIFDLLSKRPGVRLRLRENPRTKRFYVPDLKKFMVVKADQVDRIIRRAASNALKVNPGALRWGLFLQDTHRIFCMGVEQCLSSSSGDVSVESVQRSQLLFVDLAGSETRKRIRSHSISQTLSELNLVIEMLRQRHRIVPYRDSALTKLLWNSLSGNSKAVLIGTVSPSCFSYSETLSTLQSVLRARNVTAAHAIVPERQENRAGDCLIHQFLHQICVLKSQLQEEGPDQSAIRSKILRLQSALVVGGSSIWGVWEDSVRVAEAERVGFLLHIMIVKEGVTGYVRWVDLEGKNLAIGFPWLA